MCHGAQLLAHLIREIAALFRYSPRLPSPVAECATSCAVLRKKLRTFAFIAVQKTLKPASQSGQVPGSRGHTKSWHAP